MIQAEIHCLVEDYDLALESTSERITPPDEPSLFHMSQGQPGHSNGAGVDADSEDSEDAQSEDSEPVDPDTQASEDPVQPDDEDSEDPGPNDGTSLDEF